MIFGPPEFRDLGLFYSLGSLLSHTVNSSNEQHANGPKKYAKPSKIVKHVVVMYRINYCLCDSASFLQEEEEVSMPVVVAQRSKVVVVGFW